MELWLYSRTLVWYQTRQDGNLAMAILMSRVPPLLWHKHATTKSGGPSATFICYEYSCMQVFILQLHVCPRKWVELWLYSWTLVLCQTGVEIWLYSWTLVLCQTRGGNLAIFMDSCIVSDRGGNLAIFMYCWLDSGKISWLYYSGTLQQRTQYI